MASCAGGAAVPACSCHLRHWLYHVHAPPAALKPRSPTSKSLATAARGVHRFGKGQLLPNSTAGQGETQLVPERRYSARGALAAAATIEMQNLFLLL
jgi:hypothetical protein